MKRLIGSFIDIRKGEVGLVALMCGYYYLILVTNYFLKPTRDSLFLVRLGAEQLPMVFILIALIVLPVTTSYARLSRSFTLTNLINITTAILIVCLFVLRLLIDLDQSWVYYLFYVWVSIYGVLSTSQFWLFANTVFNPAQAKRLFPIMNVGGILGAVTGGEVTGLFVQNAGIATENLLFFCMGFLVVCIVLLNYIWRIKEREGGDHVPLPASDEQKRDSLGEMIRTTRRSRSLKFIVAIIATTVVATAFVDFQFKTISLSAFPDTEDLTSFMGKFYGRIGLVALLIQVFLSSRLLRVLGVGGAILFLPLSLGFGSLALFLAPGLWTAVFLRGADQSFRYSLNKTGLELLFLPVPLEMKKRTKVFIDVFVDQLAQGLSGVLLLLCTLVLGLSMQSLSLVVMAFSGLWVFLAIRGYKEYVNAFRTALERREINLGELSVGLDDATSLDTLRNTLKSDNERQLSYALDILSTTQAPDLLPSVFPLLTHKSSDLRLRSLKVLQNMPETVDAADIVDLLQDSDQEVRIEAMRLLCAVNSDTISALKSYLTDPDLRIQSAAIVCISEVGNPEAEALVRAEVIESLLSHSGEEGIMLRRQIARALGAIRTSTVRPYLLALIDDPERSVARAAIEGTGASHDPELIPILLQKLSDSTYRVYARSAFAQFGPEALEPLRVAVTGRDTDADVRRHIPRVLRDIPVQKSVDILLDVLEDMSLRLQYPIVKALNKLHKYPVLRIAPERVQKAVLDEAQVYYESMAMEHVAWQDSPEIDLLRRSLRDRQRQSLELIFRLLGLVYPSQDIYNAYEGIINRNDTLRSSAIEFLDNVLSTDLKRFLLPILDQTSVERTIDQGRELFGFLLAERGEALAYMVSGRDDWLRSCAIAAIEGEPSTDLISKIQLATSDRTPLVRETAEMMLRKLGIQ
ncbi:MAG: hypothetical protein HOH43_24825 [Candidatus Latescibacteria bacterium]|nr:hypothetical protein [Candidatus Latescibacterota bacterium]